MDWNGAGAFRIGLFLFLAGCGAEPPPEPVIVAPVPTPEPEVVQTIPQEPFTIPDAAQPPAAPRDCSRVCAPIVEEQMNTHGFTSSVAAEAAVPLANEWIRKHCKGPGRTFVAVESHLVKDQAGRVYATEPGIAEQSGPPKCPKVPPEALKLGLDERGWSHLPSIIGILQKIEAHRAQCQAATDLCLDGG